MRRLLSDQEIEEAKARTVYSHADPHHEHPDCIRIAYEWLDAQARVKQSNYKISALKHIIESWAGRYVSQSDVEVAAALHADIKGTYPFYNISSKLTEPSIDRLQGISQAMTMQDYCDRYKYSPKIYTQPEEYQRG